MLRLHPDASTKVAGMILDGMMGAREMADHGKTLKIIAPTGFGVSTMTTVIKLSVDSIDLEAVEEFVREERPTHMGMPLTTARPGKKRRGAGAESADTFHNQLTVRVVDEFGKKAVKVFVNGVLHITGPKSVKDSVAIAHTICTVLERIAIFDDDVGEEEGRIVVEDMKICMINTNFSTGEKLRLMEVKRRLLDLGKECSYDPEGYPAVSFRHERVSVFVFATGKVIITGGKSFEDVAVGYRFVTSFLDQHVHDVRAKPLRLDLR